MYKVHIVTMAAESRSPDEGWDKTGDHFDRDEVAADRATLIALLRRYRVHKQVIAFQKQGRSFHGFAIVEGTERTVNVYVMDEKDKMVQFSDEEAAALVIEAKESQ